MENEEIVVLIKELRERAEEFGDELYGLFIRAADTIEELLGEKMNRRDVLKVFGAVPFMSLPTVSPNRTNLDLLIKNNIWSQHKKTSPFKMFEYTGDARYFLIEDKDILILLSNFSSSVDFSTKLSTERRYRAFERSIAILTDNVCKKLLRYEWQILLASACDREDYPYRGSNLDDIVNRFPANITDIYVGNTLFTNKRIHLHLIEGLERGHEYYNFYTQQLTTIRNKDKDKQLVIGLDRSNPDNFICPIPYEHNFNSELSSEKGKDRIVTKGKVGFCSINSDNTVIGYV